MIAMVSLGAGCLVLALLPAEWPNPLASGASDATRAVVNLRSVATSVDAACAEGDTRAFARATTATYRRGLERQLAAVDGAITGDTLRSMAKAPMRLRDWLQQRLLGMKVAGRRVGLVVRRPDGNGAQLLLFAWQGRRFLLDGLTHEQRVGSPDDAMRVLAEQLPLPDLR